MHWYLESPEAPNRHYEALAEAQQSQLTKPAGSLGRLEELAVRLAALQNTERPSCESVHIHIFAADHGIAASGVSAFPQAVTAQMVANFARGGAAVSVLSRSLGARLDVTNVGTVTELDALVGVKDARIGAGTRNFLTEPAMSESQCLEALEVGKSSVIQAKTEGCQLWIGGEMGIANTSSASALACVLLNLPAIELSGPGTGLDSDGVQRKAELIQKALEENRASELSTFEVLKTFGGFEIAALCGAYIAAAQAGVPVLVDGFICSAAALCAIRLNPQVKPWLLLSHCSAEPGHRPLIDAFEYPPLLDLGLRLGEGSGAAVAVPLLRLACDLHNEMATFDQAGVDEKEG